MRYFTTQDLDKVFPDYDDCLEFLKNSHWSDGIECRECAEAC